MEKRQAETSGDGGLVRTLLEIGESYSRLDAELDRLETRAQRLSKHLLEMTQKELQPTRVRLRQSLESRGLLAAVVDGYLVIRLTAFADGEHYEKAGWESFAHVSNDELAVIPVDQIPGLQVGPEGTESC